MNFTDALLHLLNFVAPAISLAVTLVLTEKVFARKRKFLWGVKARLGLYAFIGIAVLIAGLLMLGRDAKMATYAALLILPTLASLTLQKFWKV